MHWHGVNEGTTCLDCHKADINTQVAEFGSQLSGDTDNLGLADRYYAALILGHYREASHRYSLVVTSHRQ